MKDFLNIGTISGTHHLKGTVKASSVFEELEFLNGRKVMLENKIGNKKILTIKNIEKMNAKRILIDFEEIKTLTEAKMLTSYKIYIRRDILPESTKDEYFLHDLIEMDVIENGVNLGQVVDVFTTAAHDIIVVNEGADEIMIPDIDVFVKDIDFKNRIIRVELIEGMR